MPMQQLKKKYLNKSTSLVEIQIPMKAKRGWEFIINDPVLEGIVKKTLEAKHSVDDGEKSNENNHIHDSVRHYIQSLELRFEQQHELIRSIVRGIKEKRQKFEQREDELQQMIRGKDKENYKLLGRIEELES